MILIIGGFSQGKTAYLKSLPEYKKLTADGKLPKVADGKLPEAADGMTDSQDLACKCPVILGFHQYIKRMSPDEPAIQAFIDRVILENPQAIITMDEVGGGIVPMDPADRIYRELVGHAGQRLAKEAVQVHRVLCGIGVRIK